VGISGDFFFVCYQDHRISVGVDVSKSFMISEVLLSKFPVGSSAMIDGLFTKARAIATRWRCLQKVGWVGDPFYRQFTCSSTSVARLFRSEKPA
jgi:hypothetical protein